MITEMELNKAIEEGGLSGGFEYEVYEVTTDSNGMCNLDGSIMYFNKGLVINAVAVQDNTEYRFNEGNLLVKPQSYKTSVGENPRYCFSAFYNTSSNPSAITTSKLTASALKFVVVYVPWDKIVLSGV